jgi:hypothetical protein
MSAPVPAIDSNRPTADFYVGGDPPVFPWPYVALGGAF